MSDASRRPLLWHVVVACVPYLALHVWLFWTPLSTGSYLAFTDLWDVFLPAFAAPYTAWSDFEYGGFPVFADPQSGHFYPVQQLFSQVLGSWTWYLLVPYVLASSFTYAYVFNVTRSPFAAFVAGLAYGLSEALQERAPHPTIVQGHMWLPALLLAIDRFRATRTPRWFAVTSVVVALAILTGHSQTALYMIAIGALYGLVGGLVERADVRYYFAVVIIFALGGGLTLIQNLPLLEASRYVMRDQVSFEQLTAYSMTLRDALGAVYPMVVHEGREIPVYVGLPVLLFAGVGIATARGNWRVWFWAIVAVIAVLLALGSVTPVATVAYQIPLYDKFRILSRHLVFATFGAIAVASFGLAALPRMKRPARTVAASACVLAAVMAAGLWMLWTDRAGEVESHTWALFTEGYFQTTVPLQLAFFVATVTVALLLARTGSRVASAAAVVFVAILGADLLGSQFVEITAAGFRFPHLAPPSILEPSVHTAWLRDELTSAGQRVVALHGSASDPVVGGQFAKVWGVRSASGYNSMLLTHFNALSTIGKQGDINPQALRPDDVGLDLMGIRYLVAQPKLIDAEETFEQDGYEWSEEPLHLTVGRQKCGISEPATLRLSPRTQGLVSAIAFVGHLKCAEDTAQGTDVGALRVIATDGSSHEHPLRAGIELSEAAHQRADVRDRVKHARARVFGGSTDDESQYLVTVVLDSPIEIDHIELTQSSFAGWMELDRLTLVSKEGTQRPQSFLPLLLNDEARFREVRRFRTSQTSDRGRDEDAENEQEFVVIENRRAMPRAWIANRVLAISEPDQGEAMRQSILPDGTRFDPVDTALVSPEDPPTVANGAPDRRPGQVRAVTGANGNVRIDVEGDGGFLVLNDIWYPGWEARIDGAPTRLHRANVAMMGVVLPSGTHRVEFAFVSWSKIVGAWLSAAAAIALVGVTLVRPIGRRIGLQTA